MFGTIVAAIFAAKTPLTKAETSMIEALQTRDVVRVKSLIKKQVSLFTIIDGREGKIKPGLYEPYLVALDTLKSNTETNEFKIGLERLAKIMALSQHKGKTDSKFLPVKVKSIHNDLTKNTIRGLVKPDDYWEIHYDAMKDGKLVIQRICEFDHASKFVW